MSSLLRDLGTRRTRATTLSLSTPWGADIPGSSHPGMYIVVSGTAWISVDGQAPALLEEGDVAVLPRGSDHVLASAPDARVRPVAEVCATASVDVDGNVVGGGGGTATELRTMCFEIESAAAKDVALFAPPLVVLPRGERESWLSHVVRAVADALETKDAPGGALGEVVLLEALREGASRDVTTVRDRTIARAVAILRSDLSQPPSIASLARRVGLSRSAFFDRFVRATGVAPGEYLLRARMERAATLVSTGDSSVEQVAAAVGYRWPSSFTVAYRRYYGVAPSVMATRRRRAARAG